MGWGWGCGGSIGVECGEFWWYNGVGIIIIIMIIVVGLARGNKIEMARRGLGWGGDRCGNFIECCHFVMIQVHNFVAILTPIDQNLAPGLVHFG